MLGEALLQLEAVPAQGMAEDLQCTCEIAGNALVREGQQLGIVLHPHPGVCRGDGTGGVDQRRDVKPLRGCHLAQVHTSLTVLASWAAGQLGMHHLAALPFLQCGTIKDG